MRRLVAQRKKAHTPADLDRRSALLLELLERHPAFRRARTVLLYYSLPDEVRTHSFVEKWSRSKHIVLPVVVGGTLELRRYTGVQGLQKGSFGIEEPRGERLSDYAEVDLAVVPGVSFDRAGNRLGRGKGYYDRLLPLLPRAYKIGVCFHFQVSESLNPDAFDVPMDEVWSECGKL